MLLFAELTDLINSPPITGGEPFLHLIQRMGAAPAKSEQPKQELVWIDDTTPPVILDAVEKVPTLRELSTVFAKAVDDINVHNTKDVDTCIAVLTGYVAELKAFNAGLADNTSLPIVRKRLMTEGFMAGIFHYSLYMVRANPSIDDVCALTTLQATYTAELELTAKWVRARSKVL